MLYQRPSLACTCVSLGTSVSFTSLASWTSRSYLRFVVKWPSGRPTSLAARLTILVACGVNRLTPRSLSRKIVATSLPYKRFFMSLFDCDSSSIFICNSALTVCISSLSDCSSSLELFNSSLVLCNSSLFDCNSSFADRSSSCVASISSALA